MLNEIQTNMYDWLCIDLETANSRPEELIRWMQYDWAPNPKHKADTIGEKYLEMYQKQKEKMGLLNGSPIISIGLKSDRELRCLHNMYQHEPLTEHGALIEGLEDVPQMLIALRNVIESFATPETIIVGHNIKKFDLPKLRWAYLSNGLRIPDVIAMPSQPMFDSMVEYRRYSIKEQKFMVSLETIMEELGLESHKGIISGAEIPKLYEACEFDAIIKYQLLDVIAESDLYLRMTGQHIDLK